MMPTIFEMHSTLYRPPTIPNQQVADGRRPPLDQPTAGGGPVPPQLAALLQEMWHSDPRIRPPMAEAARRFREIVGGTFAAPSGKSGGEGAEEQPAAVGALPPLLDVGAAAYDKAALSPPAESGDTLGGAGAAEVVAAAEAAATVGAAAAGAVAAGVAGEAFVGD